MELLPEIHFKDKGINRLRIDIMSFAQFRKNLAHVKNHNPLLPHRVKFNILLFIEKGAKGLHTIDFESFAFTVHSILLVAQDQVHSFQSIPAHHEGFIMLFSDEILLDIGTNQPELINHLYNNQLYHPVINFEKAKFQELVDLLRKVKQEVEQKRAFFTDGIAKAYTKIILLELLRNRANHDAQKSNPHINEFIRFQKLLKKELGTSKKVNYFAQLMHMTPKKLNLITQEAIGHSAKEYISSIVMLEAKRLLRCSDLTNKEIAFELGFDEPTNFTKFFKKYAGQSPSKFAQSNL